MRPDAVRFAPPIRGVQRPTIRPPKRPDVTQSDPHSITRNLQRARAGEPGAVDALLPGVYAELRGLAQAVFARERPEHTLQPTALVHEAWLKLAGNLGEVADRTHFYAIAAQAMRRVLTDHARGARRQKRASSHQRVTLDDHLLAEDAALVDFVELDACLERLAKLNERHARLIELRFFAGLTIPEVAEVLEISHATVERDWFCARAWLRVELGSG